MEFYLIRHGDCLPSSPAHFNEEKQTMDPPFTRKGERQARQLAARLRFLLGMPPVNCSISILLCKGGEYYLHSFNDYAHLEGGKWMVTLRNFEPGDRDFLATHFRQGMTPDEALALIEEWKQKNYKGNYFEQFAILSDSVPVGWISLYAPDAPVVGVGFEIIARERRKGYCCQAVQLALEHAKTLGYTAAFSQVRKNNIASIKLHEKCGFTATGECLSRSGNEVFLYRKEI